MENVVKINKVTSCFGNEVNYREHLVWVGALRDMTSAMMENNAMT